MSRRLRGQQAKDILSFEDAGRSQHHLLPILGGVPYLRLGHPLRQTQEKAEWHLREPSEDRIEHYHCRACVFVPFAVARDRSPGWTRLLLRCGTASIPGSWLVCALLHFEHHLRDCV